jgi:hypothetical protein
MKRFFTQLKTRRAGQKRLARLVPPEDVLTLLIMANEDPHYLSGELRRLFPNARISYCYPRSQKTSEAPQGTYDYHPSDLNLTGKVKSDKLQELLRSSFDLVLDLSDKNLIGDFLFQQIKVGFSIGFSCFDQDEKHDLIVRGDTDALTCIQAAKQHLTLLNQHE